MFFIDPNEAQEPCSSPITQEDEAEEVQVVEVVVPTVVVVEPIDVKLESLPTLTQQQAFQNFKSVRGLKRRRPRTGKQPRRNKNVFLKFGDMRKPQFYGPPPGEVGQVFFFNHFAIVGWLLAWCKTNRLWCTAPLFFST